MLLPPTSLRFFADGLQIVVPADPRQVTTFVLAEQGDWFEPEIRFVRRWLQTGMSVVDIGANFGVYTLSAARRVGPTGRVWGFEPAAFPRSCLAQSLAANGFQHVVLRPEAVSDRPGFARLDATAGAELARLRLADLTGETVPVTTLDAALPDFARPVDFLKLDAEGEEARILRGARQFFASHDPLVLCEWPAEAGARAELVEQMDALSLRRFRLLPGPGLLAPLASAGPLDAFQLNFFAAGARRVELLRASGHLAETPPPVPDTRPEEDRLVVQTWLASRPWARGLWPAGCAEVSPRVLRALADVLRGEDGSRAPAERWAWLERAQKFLQAPRPPRFDLLCTAARVGFDLGAQQAACGALGLAQALLPSLTEDSLDPFLPPLPEQDDLTPTGPLAAWLQAMVDEAVIARGAHSVCFALRALLPTLERLTANPHGSAAARRRLEAVRLAQRAEKAAARPSP